jgi:sulfur-oxidizing protein SoxZ
MTKPRIKLPDIIRIGDIIEIKALISHAMETGQRRDATGQLVARNIIKTFKATFNGQPVFTADLQPGISANPFIAFHMKVTGPGDLELAWTDDSNMVIAERQSLILTQF